MSDAQQTQVDGDHYVGMGLQPLEATYLRYGYQGVRAAIHTKIDKYIGRDKEGQVHGVELQKAEHCIALLRAFYARSLDESEELE